MINEKYWCCLGKHGRFDYTSIAFKKIDSITRFVQCCYPEKKTHKAIMEEWRLMRKKYGWKCVKVFVTIKQR